VGQSCSPFAGEQGRRRFFLDKTQLQSGATRPVHVFIDEAPSFVGMIAFGGPRGRSNK
jgi:hypothetical protein